MPSGRIRFLLPLPLPSFFLQILFFYARLAFLCSANSAIADSEACFQNIQDMIKSAIFLKQQLKYEEARSRQHNKGSSSSVGGRLLFGRLDSSIDYGVAAVRETSSAVANMRARPTTGQGAVEQDNTAHK